MPSYVIISPVRNEELYLQKTIDSVVSQTLPPTKWIIVNDGSTDSTGAIVDNAAKQHPWITVVHRLDRGFRKSGGGVIEAFYDGYALLQQSPLHPRPSTLDLRDWDFLVKLDGDLSFDLDYFERCFAHFGADLELGIGGGVICGEINGTLVEESPGDPAFHVRGATKIYRRACWDAIGELVKAPGWDTLDEVKANMLGWKTCTFPELKLKHYRFTGNADGAWKNWVKNGRANYVTGYHPLFMFLKCAKRLLKKPYGIASLGLLSGFCGAYLRRIPQVNDAELIKYVRRQQLSRLFLRKSIWG